MCSLRAAGVFGAWILALEALSGSPNCASVFSIFAPLQIYAFQRLFRLYVFCFGFCFRAENIAILRWFFLFNDIVSFLN